MKISALLLSSVSKAASVFDDFCDGRTDGLYQYPWDCQKFYNCAHGVTYIQSCGTGTVFNPATKNCDWPYNTDQSGCDLDPSSTTTASTTLTTSELSTTSTYEYTSSSTTSTTSTTEYPTSSSTTTTSEASTTSSTTTSTQSTSTTTTEYETTPTESTTTTVITTTSSTTTSTSTTSTSTTSTSTLSTTTNEPAAVDCNDGFNGGCSHYCNNDQCSCPDCWSMKDDGKTCLPQSSLAEITCSPAGMSLSLHQCVLPGVTAPTLLDTDCTATLEDDTFTLDTTLDGCDTMFVLDDDVVTFTNYLLAPGGVSGGIVTSKPVQLEFSCDFSVGANVNLTTTGNGLFGNTSLASAPIEVTFGVGDDQPAFGAFSYTLAFYEDESFDTLMDMENKIVSVGDTIYAAVSVDVPVAGLEFTIEECVIEDPAAGMSLTMIDDQCGEPIIETSIGSYSDSEMITFSFMSFLFPSKSRNWSEQSQMQLSCSIYVCDEHDSGSLCSVDPGCGSRKRRSAGANRSLFTNSVQFNVRQ